MDLGRPFPARSYADWPRVGRLPPWWVIFYLCSILAAGVAGSDMDTMAGVNVEHVFLGAALGLVLMFLLFEGRFRNVGGLNCLKKYLGLFVLAIFLGLLSSMYPGPKIVGASVLIYWCGLVVSIGVAAVAALCGYTSWVLAAVVLAGLPLFAAVLQPFFPFLSQYIPMGRLHPTHGGRATGFFSNPNWTGFALYISLAACLCCYYFVHHRIVKHVLLFLGAFYVVAVATTVSRGSILVMALTLSVFIFTIWRETTHRFLLLSAVAVIVVVAVRYFLPMYSAAEMMQSRVFDTSLYEHDTFRFRGLAVAAQNSGRLFALGEGTRQFPMVSGPYVGKWGKASHNQILAVWVEWGMLSLLLMYWAHAWVICRAIRNGCWHADNAQMMLLTSYICVLLCLQVHETNTPASCALLGLCCGHVFAWRSRETTTLEEPSRR